MFFSRASAEMGLPYDARHCDRNTAPKDGYRLLRREGASKTCRPSTGKNAPAEKWAWAWVWGGRNGRGQQRVEAWQQLSEKIFVRGRALRVEVRGKSPSRKREEKKNWKGERGGETHCWVALSGAGLCRCCRFLGLSSLIVQGPGRPGPLHIQRITHRRNFPSYSRFCFFLLPSPSLHPIRCPFYFHTRRISALSFRAPLNF